VVWVLSNKVLNEFNFNYDFLNKLENGYKLQIVHDKEGVFKYSLCVILSVRVSSYLAQNQKERWGVNARVI